MSIGQLQLPNGYNMFNFNFFMMRNLILTLLSLLTVGAYAQDVVVKDTVLTQKLEEVVNKLNQQK